MTPPKCFKCNGLIQAATRWIEYSSITGVSVDGYRELGDVEDSVEDTSMETFFWCDRCNEKRDESGGDGIKKYDVEIAVLFSQPESYELHQLELTAYDEEDAAKKGEDQLSELFESSEDNTHNVAGFFLWRVHESEVE